MLEGLSQKTQSPKLEAVLGESRKVVRNTLAEFLASPIQPHEVESKMEFMQQVNNWLANALKEAQYPVNEIGRRLSNAFDKKDFFNRDPEIIAKDVNRVINNWAIESRSFSQPEKPAEIQTNIHQGDQESTDTKVVSQANPLQVARPIIPTIPVMAAQNSKTTPVSQFEEKSEAYSTRSATEFDDREAEYAEYNKSQFEPVPITPVVPEVAKIEMVSAPSEVQPLENKIEPTSVEQFAITPIILTPEMQVVDSNEPIVLETVSADDEVTPERRNVGLEYQNKLDAINAQPFNHDAYVEYMFDVHTGLRHEYDEVINSARKNLKRFDGIYAPSTLEKQALQLLSSLQGQYAKMQQADSEIGIIRTELIHSLENTDQSTNENNIKILTQNYLEATKKLFITISKLEELVEVVKLEDKPPVAEAYRAQFEKIKADGNQVLRSLPDSHPLYERLKTAVEVDLQKIIQQASVENGGDKAVLENSSNFIARRDQIKELISFIKKEQEYQDFFERARARVQKLESQSENILLSDTASGIKKSLEDNIDKIKQTLALTSSQIATVGVLDALAKQKDTVQGLLLESGELLASLPASEVDLSEQPKASVATHTELIAKIEQVAPKAEIAPLFLRWAQRVNQPDNRAQESGVNLERIKNIALKIQRTKIARAAAVVLALLPTADNANQSVNNLMSGGTMMSALGMPSSQIDANAINAYLRTSASVGSGDLVMEILPPNTISPDAQPSVIDAVPELEKQPTVVEAVPGVILPDMISRSNDETQDMPSEIFSDLADEVPKDKGIEFASPNKSNVPEALRKPYKINFGDKFWDINEGQTLAGKLPVMSQINPYFKQALIDRVRDKINSDSALRDAIGGFGKNADQLRTGELMNLDKLNELGVSLAVEYGYLK